MPTDTGRAFTTANFLANLAALKAINFGSSDPLGTWFVVPNQITNNVEIWVWEPASTVATNEIDVVRPDSIVPGSPGRCVQRLKFDASQLGGVLAGIALLNTAGLIERTSGGEAGIVELSTFIRALLNDADAATARATLGVRDAADSAYSDARIPLSHADTHLAGGTDLLGLGDAAFRGIGNSNGQIRDAADDAYSNARTPTAHASTHAVGGTDPITVFGYLLVSTNSTLTASNQRQLIDVNATSGVITITLPAAVTVGSGWAVQIRKSDASANLVTIARAGSDTINGVTTLSLAVQHQSLILFSLGGTSWGVVAGFDGMLPANSLLGTGATAGMVGVIPSSTFAPSSALTSKADLVGGVVPSSQLPSYVDDVLDFAVLANFPVTGETGKIYVATDTNVTYRWSGSAYVEISASLALGTTSATAYRGDFGNTAYTHSQIITGNPHGLTAVNLNLGNLDNTSDINKPISTAQQTALNLKANLASPTFTGTIGGITAAMVGLGSANNTSDIAKPVSTAQQAALDLKANLASPNFTGTPLVPTAVAGTNTTQVANTAFVAATIASLVNSSPALLDTLGELATALGNDPNFATTVTALIGTKLSIASNLSDLNNRQTALNTLAGGVNANRVLRGNGTNIALGQVDLTTDVTGSLPAANGGLTTGVQTIAGNKTLSSVIIVPNASYGFNIAPITDGYNTCRFTASDASYWDFGIAPVTSGKPFYISSGTAGGGISGFQINASNYNISTSGILSVTNTTQSTSTTTGALVVSGGAAVGGNLNVGGFTSLGDNVAIKKKYLTGVAGGTQGSTVAIPHGLDVFKIVGISILVSDFVGRPWGPEHSHHSGYRYHFYLEPTSVIITLNNDSSGNIVGGLVKIVIEYIQ